MLAFLMVSMSVDQVKAQGACVCDDGGGNVIANKCVNGFGPVCDIPNKSCNCLGGAPTMGAAGTVCASAGSDAVCSGVPEGDKCWGGIGDGYCHKYPGQDTCWCGGSVKNVKSWCVNGNPSDTPDENNPVAYTAIGCIPLKINKMMETFIPYFFGITGGISFLLMVYGFILMAMSAGDPKAIAGAQETITSAITGLVLSVFGIFIVRLIILDILKLPGI